MSGWMIESMRKTLGEKTRPYKLVVQVNTKEVAISVGRMRIKGRNVLKSLVMFLSVGIVESRVTRKDSVINGKQRISMTRLEWHSMNVATMSPLMSWTFMPVGEYGNSLWRKEYSQDHIFGSTPTLQMKEHCGVCYI